MSSPIPPEREAAYLQNAREAFEEAAQPVVEPAVRDLGELVVKDAEGVAEQGAQAMEHPPTERAHLSKVGFGDTTRHLAEIQNRAAQKELWTRMAQNEQADPHNPPQE